MAHRTTLSSSAPAPWRKWCKEGWDVFYVLVTGGDKGTHDETMTRRARRIREEEQREACPCSA